MQTTNIHLQSPHGHCWSIVKFRQIQVQDTIKKPEDNTTNGCKTLRYNNVVIDFPIMYFHFAVLARKQVVMQQLHLKPRLCHEKKKIMQFQQLEGVAQRTRQRRQNYQNHPVLVPLKHFFTIKKERKAGPSFRQTENISELHVFRTS